MVSIVIGEPNGGVLRLVLGVENIQRVCPILWYKYLNRSIEELTSGLNLWVVPVDSLLAFPLNILFEGFLCDELRKMLLITCLHQQVNDKIITC